jgi:hypothetical protein
MPGNFGRSILDHLANADAIAKGVDELMRSDEFAKAGSNEAYENGQLAGHLVVGPDGQPKLERLPQD